MEKVELNINGEALANVSLNKNDSIENLEDENAEKIPGKFGDANGKIRVIDGKNPNTYRHITQYANATDIKPVRDNGNTSGSLDGFTIDTSGTVIGRFTNGVQKGLGRIVLSKFSNPTGLEKMGNNLFATTRNSGDPQLGTAGDSGFGSIASSTLEMSNVDISFEFTEMITTQRGFQANSRVITTSDEMLQELVNIKR